MPCSVDIQHPLLLALYELYRCERRVKVEPLSARERQEDYLLCCWKPEQSDLVFSFIGAVLKAAAIYHDGYGFTFRHILGKDAELKLAAFLMVLGPVIGEVNLCNVDEIDGVIKANGCRTRLSMEFTLLYKPSHQEFRSAYPLCIFCAEKVRHSCGVPLKTVVCSVSQFRDEIPKMINKLLVGFVDDLFEHTWIDQSFPESTTFGPLRCAMTTVASNICRYETTRAHVIHFHMLICFLAKLYGCDTESRDVVKLVLLFLNAYFQTPIQAGSMSTDHINTPFNLTDLFDSQGYLHKTVDTDLLLLVKSHLMHTLRSCSCCSWFPMLFRFDPMYKQDLWVRICFFLSVHGLVLDRTQHCTSFKKSRNSLP